MVKDTVLSVSKFSTLDYEVLTRMIPTEREAKKDLRSYGLSKRDEHSFYYDNVLGTSIQSKK